MRRYHTLKIGLASTLTCLALLLGLFTTGGTVSAASTPHITVSAVSLASTNCLTFQLTGSGFSAHSTAELVALAPSTGANIQPGQVLTDNKGKFSTEATACVPTSQGSSIQFSVRVRDDHTGKQSNTVQVTYDQSISALTPTITVSNPSIMNTNCLAFQVAGNGFSHHFHVDLSAQDGSFAMVTIQPNRVLTDGKGTFTTAATACGNFNQSCAPAAGSFTPCAATPTTDGSCPVSGVGLPGFCNQPWDILFSLTAKDEHTGVQTNPYPVTYYLLTTAGTPQPTSTLTISVSGLTMENANCLSFQVTGKGFAHYAYVDLTALDASGAAVTLQPSRVSADSKGTFTTPVTACGNFSQSTCDPTESVTSSCAAAPTPAGPCYVSGYQLPGFCSHLGILFYLTGRDEHTGAQTAPYPVTSGLSIPPGPTPSTSMLTISVSGLTMENANCLAFQVAGNGFSHHFHVDLSAQDASGAMVTIQPNRVLTDSKGNFTTAATACGNFSLSGSPDSGGWCDIPFLSTFFCNTQGIQFSLTAKDEHTGAQTIPYPVTYGSF